MRAEDLRHALLVANVGLLEGIAFRRARAGERLEIAGVRKAIDVDDTSLRLLDEVTDRRGADEACSACDEDVHEFGPDAGVIAGGRFYVSFGLKTLNKA